MKRYEKGSVVCLGYFDGVHLGHIALLQRAKAVAAEHDWLVIVHTFDHSPGKGERELTGLEERERLLYQFGADEIVVSNFEQIRHLSGEDFFQHILCEKLNARHLVCGEDHRFGYQGKCGAQELTALCQKANVGLSLVPQILFEGEKISTTRIRNALDRGDRALAEQMLGHPLCC